MQVAVYLSLGQTNFTSNVWSITAANAVIFGEALHVCTSLTGKHAGNAMQLRVGSASSTIYELGTAVNAQSISNACTNGIGS